jgi:hypothetical protein
MRLSPFQEGGTAYLISGDLKLSEFLILVFRIRCDLCIRDIRHMQRINKWKADQVRGARCSEIFG